MASGGNEIRDNGDNGSLNSPNFHRHLSLDEAQTTTTTNLNPNNNNNFSRNSLPLIHSDLNPIFPSPNPGNSNANSNFHSGNSNSNSVSGSHSGFQRTMESARYFRDNLNSVLREFQPLVVENARSVPFAANLLTRNSSVVRQNSAPPSQSAETNSVVVNIEPIEPDVVGNTESENATRNNIDSSDNAENRNLETVHEAQQMVQVILKYVPFILILLAKTIYDYHEGIFVILIMLVTFSHANSAVKREAIKRERRSLKNLAIALFYIAACCVFLFFVFQYRRDGKFDGVLMNLMLFTSLDVETFSCWSLLWMVVVSDFVFKLVTVVIKLLFTTLPNAVMKFQKRGKIYLFIEAASQTYRSMATIRPWLYYLLGGYSGPEKIVAVFLSAFYILVKSPDLMCKLTMLKNASFKLLQDVTIGQSPSKEQMHAAGDHCPICHDKFESPVLLECRHIFCEKCVTTWFDREQTCPLCRAKIVDDPSWKDGSTTFFIQIF